MEQTSTVAAIATPNAAGGIGIVRISGGDAIAVADKVFSAVSGKPLSEAAGYSAHFGTVSLDGKPIDEAIALVFRAPKSYTGEDTVELSCHGGVYIVRQVLRAVLNAGAQPAGPGEFTKRAFLNGRIDLAKAESVMSLISAQGEQAASAAFNTLEGRLSDRIESVAHSIINVCAHLSAWVDYPDEDIEELSTDELEKTFSAAQSELESLISGFENGKAVTQGVDTVIVGRPNVGKSTLMKMIAGWVKPDSGTIEIGQTVKLGYFSQENEDMDTSLKVIDYIKNVAEYVKTKDGSISASQMLERFLFPPSVQYTVIEKLSGGERRRLYLLKILMSAPNVLILDEPTNDLDIRTLMILEDYLDSFQGIVITVSHDRYFLDRVVGRIFAFEGDRKLQQYEGGFTDYQAAKAERAAKRAESAAENPASAKTSPDKGDGTAAEGDPEGNAPRTNVKPREKKLKFSYKEQREWDTIEDDIAKLEEAVENLEKEIEASATNFTKLNELMKEKEEKEAALEEKMDRWVYLNDLAEQIEAQKNK